MRRRRRRARLAQPRRIARRETLPASAALPAGLLTRLAGREGAALPLLPERRLRALGPAAAAQAAIRALATAIPLDQPGAAPLVLCRVLGRFKMLVAAADLAHAPHLMLDGYWKWWITAFLSRNLRPGQRVVDAGAGYGYFSLLAAALVGASGHVLAIEANPLLAGLLRRNLALNGADQAEARHGALGHAEAGAGLAWLTAPPDSPAAARLLRPAEVEQRLTLAAGLLEAPALPPLDRLLPEGADWIRMDLNGAERASWDGMQGLLDRCPGLGVILAFAPGRLPDAGAWLERIAARFPLRRIDADGIARPVRAEAIPADGETTLCLLRGEPR